MKKKTSSLLPVQIEQRCRDFLQKFEGHAEGMGEPAYAQYGKAKYMILMQQVANLKLRSVDIEIEDMATYFKNDADSQIVWGAINNTDHYTHLFTTLVARLMPDKNLLMNPEDEVEFDLKNRIKKQRELNFSIELTNRPPTQNQEIPTRLSVNYDVNLMFGPSSPHKPVALSNLKSASIGSLVHVRAIVVRAQEVTPVIEVATYSCDVCGGESYQIVNNSHFSQLTKCMTDKCRSNNVLGKLTFLAGHSKFRSRQVITLQEESSQVLEGRTPSTISVRLGQSYVNCALPGDLIELEGVLKAERGEGRFHYQDLTFGSFIEATRVQKLKCKYTEIHMDDSEIRKIVEVQESMKDDELFDKLARSIAPQIYGMDAVKKGLLLMMVGGVGQQTPDDKMRIRGHINIALVGDPGIAKSQLLKQVAFLSPRGIYTTGKMSSGAGLTAAVTVHPDTRQLSLEAGAVVMADRGICCIDEFDKMQQLDRSSLYEVMEQQMVSIAKAGITANLNARTSILAAANPLYGRYNRHQTVEKNINLPPALLSRFDLIFTLLDTHDRERDGELSRHILSVHQKGIAPTVDTFDAMFIRRYISKAQTYEPVMTIQAEQTAIEYYIKKRKEFADVVKAGQAYITTRSLLAIIRLAQARARLRFSSQVTKFDILDAIDLVEESQLHTSVQPLPARAREDNISSTFEIIKSICGYDQNGEADYSTIERRVLGHGFDKSVLDLTIKNYTMLDILYLRGDKIIMIK